MVDIRRFLLNEVDGLGVGREHPRDELRRELDEPVPLDGRCSGQQQW
jgi:hypothetical protein